MRLPDMEKEVAERLDPKFRRMQAAEERRLAELSIADWLKNDHLKKAAMLDRMADRLEVR